MSYLHIENLYKNQEILMFKECWATEKLHGSSGHVSFNYNYNNNGDKLDPQVIFFCRGCKKELFEAIFDKEELKKKFIETGLEAVTIYGEAIGGKMQGMSHTYGKELKFVAFEVKIGHCWLDVPKAHKFCKEMGIEFVAYEKTSTNLEDLDRERDRPSRQAKRNGIIEDKISEGIVIRPLIELKKNNGARIIAKHKRDEFMETQKPRKVQDPAKLKVLTEAKAIAEEWVTINRLSHILQKIEDVSMENIKEIIKTMIEDIKREGDKEIIWNKTVEKYIGQTTAKMTKQYFQNKLKEK